MNIIDGVKILSLEIELVGKKDEETDLGSVTISRDGREYVLDTCMSYSDFEDGITTIEAILERDDEIFDECPYDITAEDLASDDLVIEFYIETENEIQSMVLVVEFPNELGIKMLNVIQEK